MATQDGSVPSQSPISPGHSSFRRQRASRACQTCHTRKVRCDAASLGIPCTNCTAFGIDCVISNPKRRKTLSNAKDKQEEQEQEVLQEVTGQSKSPVKISPSPSNSASASKEKDRSTIFINSADGTPSSVVSDAYASQQSTHNNTYLQFMKPRFARAPIREAGRVAYLGESSNLSLLVHDRFGSSDVVHYPLPENVRGTKARANELDDTEIDILHQRGAFLLPPRALCDELVEAFFKWVAPVAPVINRSRFMKQYRDTKNPPSLLLLQAILLAGSRACTNPQLMDSSGSTTPAAMTFYKRAKALFEANYEDDRVTIVQALLLMAWYWEGPEDVTKNVFYWTRVAIVVAQGSGMHRSVEGSQLNKSDKRLWKRIWWTLFSRDRSVAVALGRPVGINPEDSDVEMITEDDFIEDHQNSPAEFPPDPIHVHFFISYVKLADIMGLVLSQQYAVASKYKRTNFNLAHADMALADWLRNCPTNVQYDRNNHNFWAALLHSNYYTTLCLLHRAHMPAADSPKANAVIADSSSYPSRAIAYQAATMITFIAENLQAHKEMRYTPAFILFSALIMHVYQMRSTDESVIAETAKRLQICMKALKEVSKVWLVARMVHTLFESVLSNKNFEEKLQKSAGKRHKTPQQSGVVSKDEPPTKRKFDVMDLGLPNKGPAHQLSYERSQPQTPSVIQNREVGGSISLPPIVVAELPSSSSFLGGGVSRGNTRQTTPFNFNPAASYPSTPPDIILITRNSPDISSSDLWQNFQPDQLFPAETDFNQPFATALPMQQSEMLDPLLSNTRPSPSATLGAQQPQPPPVALLLHTGTNGLLQQNNNSNNINIMPEAQVGGGEVNAWSSMEFAEDPWNSGITGQDGLVPATLNVEDWFNFFGIPGDGNSTT